MSRDELYNKLNDNKDTLVHNRNLLLECKSIRKNNNTNIRDDL